MMKPERPAGKIPPGRGSQFLTGDKSLFASSAERRIAEALDQGLEQIESGLKKELSYTNQIADSVARYLFDAGGKRVRPLLTLLTAQWGAGVTDHVVRAAQVIELTHLATLYHDDVMDEAAKRRGVVAAHKLWTNSVAILAGDLLFARAGALGVELGQEAIRRQTETFERLVLGQMRETIGPSESEDPVGHYLQVLADKTGSLIALAGEFGLTQSGGPDEYIGPVRAFGEQIGVAFQLVDDVIDLSANEAQTGKKAGTDVRRGVVTLPMLLLAEESGSDSESAALLNRLGQGAAGMLEESELVKVIGQLREHRVTEQTMERAREVADSAAAQLDGLPQGVITDALRRFANEVVGRKN